MSTKISDYKYSLFFFVITAIYSLSFSVNILRVTDDNFRFFDRVDEEMIIGRLMASQLESPFAYSGLPGSYVFQYYKNDDGSLREKVLEYDEDGELNIRSKIETTYNDYITQQQIHEGKYNAYMTQPGGQGIMYSLLQEILPVDNGAKLQIFRLITILLSAIFLSLFMTWIYKNFNLTVAIVTFLLSAFIPIFILFGYSLWWALWSYYIPFTVLLLVLDRRKRKGVELFDNRLLLYIVGLLFMKFFFTGFEFITSVLVMSVCPIIYYLILENKSLKNSIVYFVKSSLAAVSGVLVGIAFLMTQIYFLAGSLSAGVEYLQGAFLRRSSYSEMMDKISIFDVLDRHLNREVFRFDWNTDLTIKYSTLLLIIGLLCLLFVFLRKKTSLLQTRNYLSLISITAISILGPLAWITILTQHAYTHSLDIVVWYFPFCFFGFAIIGVGVNLLIERGKSIFLQKH